MRGGIVPGRAPAGRGRENAFHGSRRAEGAAGPARGIADKRYNGKGAARPSMDMPINRRGIEVEPRKDVAIPADSERGIPLLRMTKERYTFDDIVVDGKTRQRLSRIVAENRSAKRLRRHGLAPKQKILLCGEPGTGKTLSAKIIGSAMGCPFVHVVFDALVSPLLGETAANLRKVFDFVEKGRYVVLFDEFDMIGKDRADPQEHGEIKRVVNNFMQMLDGYGGDSILIAATNHHRLLDAAVWRRFDEVVKLGVPDARQRAELFEKYMGAMKSDAVDASEFAEGTPGYSAADVAAVCVDALRKCVMDRHASVSEGDVLWALEEQGHRKGIMVSK